MIKINIEKLRKDIIDYYENAYFMGGFGAALVEIANIQNAPDEEIIEIAKTLKIDLEKYIIQIGDKNDSTFRN